MLDWLKTTMLAEGKISPDELTLLQIADDADQVVKIIKDAHSAAGLAIFDELRDQWAQRIGAAELENIEDHLTALAGAQPVRFDTPGWIARDVGEPA